MKRTAALVVSALLALTACGTSEPAASEDSGGTATATPVPISITDARNKKIDLKAPATRVVGLEWGVVENLISVGVMPVGVADVKGYTAWVTAAKLDPSVKDVGTRGESSVDAIVALNPDLVITTSDESKSAIEQIEKAVPVLVVRAADAKNAIPQMKSNLELTASAVGRTPEAQQINADFDKAVAEGKQKITDAGKAGTAFTMADGWKDGSSISIRMYTSGSLLGAVGNELGLKNAWPGEGDKDYGLAQSDLEGMTKLKDGEFLYIANKSDGGDVFGDDLAKNAIWKNLPFVKNDNVHRLEDGIWMFGGPKSTEQFIDAAVQAVTS
ncbi:iron-siderophore ABC transporter substrate-binding protein [Kribbella sandramycini]|uniref:Iron complex transport system substrate-binding protein n=1 Tax=Kribbella sandramycini TaxID=60450 RepID=A0A7Y4L6R0_9ACTN|nr:iron-siderophore ABC transporter substrate-binding protein [Kribbella sandramycini]MBB6571785.1 iron complex transport system substrate-binding protein [Kribbella sandramycini]NOL44427.1 iron-siderophore ABC transporter substrate-binding protein [Kribbella sandramycini]